MSDEPQKTKTPRKKDPSAFLRAAFQQVPYGLDSLWRWTEFRANRIGRVAFDSPHAFRLRPAWKCSAFILFSLFAWFAVLGPTPDAFCSLAGFEFANQVRVVGAIVLIVIGWQVGRRILDWATFHLARQAVDQAVVKGTAANMLDAPRAAPAEAPGKSGFARKLAAFVRLNARRREQRRLENIDKFFKSLRNIPSKDRPPLYITFFIFVLGTLLAVAPFGAAALALLTTVADPLACTRMNHPGPVAAQFVVLALVWAGGFLIWRKYGAARSLQAFLGSTLLLGLGIALLWAFFTPHAPRMYSEAQGGFYPHVYLIFAGALMAIALLARPLAVKLLSHAEGADVFRAGLKSRDLLAFRRDLPDVSGIRLLSAFVNGITSHMLHFMLLPAFVVFISPANLVWPLLWPFLFVSGVLLVYGSLSSRWAQMLVHVQRWFLVGTPLVLSILVMLLAALRLKDVQYVSTILDATPMGVLFVIVVMIYVAFWLFEFWINRWAGEQLLGLLGDDTTRAEGFVRCPYQPPAGKTCPSEPGVVTGAIPGRYIALHSTGRFVAQGWFERKPTGPQAPSRDDSFATFGLVELFDVLGSSSEVGVELAREVRRRVHLYFTFINMALVAAAIGLLFWHKNWTRPLVVHPMVDAVTIKPEEVSDAALRAKAIREGDGLAKRLQLQASAGRPSIVVAASGGGTRAAVYTAVALEGMAQIDRARDVVMLSGVSGGGVSAAVFASRFDALRGSDPRREPQDQSGPWAQYVSTVSQPYIQDVLEGVGELRIAGSWSLGSLLQESLERRAFAPRMTGIDTFGKLNDPALILNSAISGHPYGDSEVLKGRVAAPPAGANCNEQARPYANLAGGRLVFTNLGNLTGFPERSTDVPDLWLPYRIVTDGSVKLSAASALTANFPPVFSNARVRLKSSEQGVCAESYFVTDGGATENLGLVSALYALRGTLLQMEPGTALGDIHVLALEASAIDYDYHDDRGIGAATGGSKERINSGLTQALLREIEALVAAHGAKLRVHYLPLPVAFRSRGGFGTHWMFARSINVENPLLAEAPGTWESLLPEGGKDKVSLNRDEVMVTMRALFDPTDPICSRADRVQADPKSAPASWTTSVQTVTRWICGHDDRRNTPALVPDYQVEAWAKLVQDLATPLESAEFKQYSR
ncbi:MAG: patatin-like phospholipase family protein [Pseudomonadota bacterium]